MDKGNLAVKVARKPRGQMHDISHKVISKKTKVRNANYTKLILLLLVFTIGSLSLLARNVYVTEQGKKIADLKKQYSELYAENRKKEIDISRKVDLKNIEEIAVSVYGMNRAKKEQIERITVKKDDYGIVAKNGNEKNMNILTAILAYFK